MRQVMASLTWMVSAYRIRSEHHRLIYTRMSLIWKAAEQTPVMTGILSLTTGVSKQNGLHLSLTSELDGNHYIVVFDMITFLFVFTYLLICFSLGKPLWVNISLYVSDIYHISEAGMVSKHGNYLVMERLVLIQMKELRFCLYVCVCVCVPLSLSLSLTHMYIYIYIYEGCV